MPRPYPAPLFKCLHATAWLTLLAVAWPAHAQQDRIASPPSPIVARPGLFEPLTEPPCSYCATQHRKGFVRGDDRVVAWIRAAHNGGAIPLRHFLAGTRVINDTYGLFFFDPDGGYVAAYRKDYGYRFHGWRRGVMIVQGPDGTLWSALSGRALEGPRRGERLERIASLTTTWEHWLMLHPESTAYDLFDGQRYRIAALPEALHADAQASIGEVDRRLEPLQLVLGVELGDRTRAYPLPHAAARACFVDELSGEPIAVFWYGPTQSAVAFRSTVDGRRLTFYADEIAPETAPFMDRETKTRWSLAGRGIDGPLRGQELTWVPGLQCRWYAWAVEFPETSVYARAN